MYIGVIVISKIVIPGFCAIHFTVTFAGTWDFHCYTGNVVISKIITSGFHCTVHADCYIITTQTCFCTTQTWGGKENGFGLAHCCKDGNPKVIIVEVL